MPACNHQDNTGPWQQDKGREGKGREGKGQKGDRGIGWSGDIGNLASLKGCRVR